MLPSSTPLAGEMSNHPEPLRYVTVAVQFKTPAPVFSTSTPDSNFGELWAGTANSRSGALTVR
jgi:hypothetical protein